MSSLTHSACTHTHTPSPRPRFLPYFPPHLISGFHSLDVFLCCSNNFERYCLNQKNSKPVERLRGSVQLLVWNTQHFRRIIPTDTTGAAVWTFGMRQLCLTEKAVQALTIRTFFSPSESAKGLCQTLYELCVRRAVSQGMWLSLWILSYIFPYSIYCVMW